MQRRIILGTALSFLIAMMILATEGLTGQLDQTVQALQGTASFVPTSWLYLPLVQKSGWNTLLNETFEGGFPGSWQVTSNNSYYWNKRSCRAYAGSYSAWAASGSSYSCGSNYPNSTETWMV